MKNNEIGEIGYELKKYLQANGINKIIDDLEKYIDDRGTDYSNHGKIMSNLFEKLQDNYAKTITKTAQMVSSPYTINIYIDKNDPKEIKEALKYHIKIANDRNNKKAIKNSDEKNVIDHEQPRIQFLHKTIKNIKSESQRTKTFTKTKQPKSNNYEMEV